VARQRLDALATYTRRYGTTWIVGLDRQRLTPAAASGAEHYNAALVLDATGRPLACYDKMFPVMFGEYLPLGDRLPILYRLTPLPAGLTAGTAPVAVEVAGHELAPTICYETALPGGIRSIVQRLAAAGRRPDVLVNLTNDGWFWGSSELDMHLAAGIFRAVEVRTPLVIAEVAPGRHRAGRPVEPLAGRGNPAGGGDPGDRAAGGTGMARGAAACPGAAFRPTMNLSGRPRGQDGPGLGAEAAA